MRLRRALDTYYAASGMRDQIRFDIPRGGYVPHFLIDYPVAPEPESTRAAADEPSPERRRGRMVVAAMLFALLLGAVPFAAFFSPGGPATPQMAARPAPGVLPTIILEPIIVEAEAYEAFSERRFRLALSDALARFDEVRVIDRRTNSFGAQPFGIEIDVYSLSVFVSSVQADAEIGVQLLEQATGRIVWSGRFSHAAAASERELAATIAALVAQPSGVLFADLRSRGDAAPPIECLLRAFDHRAAPSQATHAQARSCLERTAVSHPNLAVVRALLSLIYLDEHRAGYNRQEAALARALSAAHHALSLNPQSARAHQALMVALLVSGDTRTALQAGARAIELNPNDGEILASLGAALVVTGDYSAGVEALEKARGIVSGLPPRYEFFDFLARDMQGEGTFGAGIPPITGRENHALGLLGRAIVAAEAGDALLAAELVRALSIVEPEFVEDPKRALERRGMSARIVERLVEGLKDAQLGVNLSSEAN
jgi:adenylate cyclase